MNLIWVLLIFGAFLSITDGVKLRPKPNWKPLYHRKTAISRWGRFHSMSGVDHDKGHQKMYPKKFGPTPASCHVDCHYDYQTSYNIPLKADEDFCPPFIRTRLVNIDFYEATNWQHICFAPVSIDKFQEKFVKIMDFFCVECNVVYVLLGNPNFERIWTNRTQ